MGSRARWLNLETPISTYGYFMWLLTSDGSDPATWNESPPTWTRKLLYTWTEEPPDYYVKVLTDSAANYQHVIWGSGFRYLNPESNIIYHYYKTPSGWNHITFEAANGITECVCGGVYPIEVCMDNYGNIHLVISFFGLTTGAFNIRRYIWNKSTETWGNPETIVTYPHGGDLYGSQAMGEEFSYNIDASGSGHLFKVEEWFGQYHAPPWRGLFHYYESGGSWIKETIEPFSSYWIYKFFSTRSCICDNNDMYVLVMGNREPRFYYKPNGGTWSPVGNLGYSGNNYSHDIEALGNTFIHTHSIDEPNNIRNVIEKSYYGDPNYDFNVIPSCNPYTPSDFNVIPCVTKSHPDSPNNVCWLDLAVVPYIGETGILSFNYTNTTTLTNIKLPHVKELATRYDTDMDNSGKVYIAVLEKSAGFEDVPDWRDMYDYWIGGCFD